MTHLWRHGPFLRLWAGETTSALGAQLGNLAIPVLAVTVLAATDLQVGFLGAAQTAAFLVVGLPAGAWIDRMRKRRVMISADIVRAVALSAIPVLWLTGALEVWHLIVIGAIVGCATVFFDVSYQSYIPILVDREQIAEANSKLETTQQLARVGGPALAGALLTLVQPALLVGATALTYVVSFLTLGTIRDSEIPPPKADRRPLAVEIKEGLAFVASQPLLRRIVLATALNNLFATLVFTMLPVLVFREIGLSPAAFGVAASAGAIGGLLGAAMSARISKRLGEGTTIPISGVVSAIGVVGFAAMTLVPSAAFVIFIVAEFTISFGVLVYNIAQVSFRQRICPPSLLGRMNASIRFIVWGVMPLAGIAAGLLSTAVGVVATCWIGAVGAVLASLPIVLSPLLRMRELPTTLEAQN